MKFINTIDYHLNNPDESVDSYGRRKSLDLSKQIKTVKKLYLDTNFWVRVCETRLGRLTDSTSISFLKILEDLVSRGLILCPISAATFAEVFRQSDTRTLSATVEIIDKLSNGVALMDEEERIRLELFHFVRQLTHAADELYALDDLVWTRTSYVLGFASPTIDSIPRHLDVAMQKAFLDQMWSISLTEMLETLGSKVASMPRLHDYSEKLNQGKFAHFSDYSSFTELFLIEVAGFLDAYKPILSDFVSYLKESDQLTADKILPRTDTELAKLIYEAFRLDDTTEFPSLRVGASLHSAVRWDSKRKYKANDAYDFHHAIAALPYCDLFLTERSLRSLVQQNNLRFSSFFRCGTFSDISAATVALDRIGQGNKQ